MINWWLVAPMVAFFIVAVIGNAGWYVDSKDLKKTRIAYWKHRDANILLEEKYAKLEASNVQYAETVVELNEEIRRLQKSADHATVPLADAAPAKRTTRKKAGQA